MMCQDSFSKDIDCNARNICTSCAIQRELCLVIHVNCLILSLDGSLSDVLAIGTRKALNEIRISESEHKSLGEMRHPSWKIQNDNQFFNHIDKLNNSRSYISIEWPLIISVSSIGYSYVMYCNAAEEASATARAECILDCKGTLLGFRLIHG